jgi:hypothetical protein
MQSIWFSFPKKTRSFEQRLFLGILKKDLLKKVLKTPTTNH